MKRRKLIQAIKTEENKLRTLEQKSQRLTKGLLSGLKKKHVLIEGLLISACLALTFQKSQPRGFQSIKRTLRLLIFAALTQVRKRMVDAAANALFDQNRPL